MARGRQPATETFNKDQEEGTNWLLQLVTLRSRTRARETWTNARALKPAGYTKTTWDRHPASFLNAPRRVGWVTKAKRTSITSNQDAGKADKAKQVQWTTWTIRGRRGASGSSLGSGRKVTLLALGWPSCKPRHVSSGMWAGEGAGQQTSPVAIAGQQTGSFKDSCRKHRSAAHTEQRFIMAHREFWLGKTSGSF